MNRIIQFVLPFLVVISCAKDEVHVADTSYTDSKTIAAVDISSYPEISESNPIFYDLEGKESNFLDILKSNGVNTIRLRLWVNPEGEHSGFNEVKTFSRTLKTQGFKTWLTLHYSDTWADPAHQEIPMQWQGLDFSGIKDSVFNYTKRVMTELQPDYIQIGNEINSGLLHPYGDISKNPDNFKMLVNEGITAVRAVSEETKIILHFAGIEGSDWFFNQVHTLDYDIIGLSYYPLWHGKSLNDLQTTIQSLGNTYSKDVLIVETAYPFTLDWDDWTDNIVGSNDQLILPDYPATREGQQNFIAQIRTIMNQVENGLGFCYWGAELISWKGSESTEASPWENQALFDFDNKALPAIHEFNTE